MLGDAREDLGLILGPGASSGAGLREVRKIELLLEACHLTKPALPQPGKRRRIADVEHGRYASMTQRRPSYPQGSVSRGLDRGVGRIFRSTAVRIGSCQGIVNVYSVPPVLADVREDIADPLAQVGVAAVIGLPDSRIAMELQWLTSTSTPEQPAGMAVPHPAVSHSRREERAVRNCVWARAAPASGCRAVIRPYAGQVFIDPYLDSRVGVLQDWNETEVPGIQDDDRIFTSYFRPLSPAC